MKKILALAVLSLAGTLIVLFLGGGKAQAASLTLSGGCSIDNAILSANNNADTGGCVGSGTYGDDEIIVPAGTWNVGANVQSEGNLTVTGSGMGVSIIDAGDSYGGIVCSNPGTGLLNFSVSGLTIRNTINNSGAFPLAAGNCNLSVSDVEITDAHEDANIYFLLEQDGVTAQLAISNAYVHDSKGSGVTINQGGDGVVNTVNAEIDNLTVTRSSSDPKILGGVSVATGDTGGNTVASTRTANVTVRNSTLTADGSNPYYGVFGVTQPEVSGTVDAVNITLENVTIIGHSIDGAFPASGILAGAFAGNGATGTTSITTKNVLVADNLANSAAANCYATGLGGGGTETATITSLGNNIADDASCGFTNTGDQENVTNILSTLGPLQDNGGSVPTMALLAGSPAIDAGAVVSGITTDQRGIARPQCAAFDVGAYEYDGVCPELVGNNSGNNPIGDTSDAQDQLAATGLNVYIYAAIVLLTVVAGAVFQWLLRRRSI